MHAIKFYNVVVFIVIQIVRNDEDENNVLHNLKRNKNDLPPQTEMPEQGFTWQV